MVNYRTIFSNILLVLMMVVGLCALFAGRSGKKIGRAVAFLELALIPPILGNFLIVNAIEESFARLGCYIYFLGMDVVMIALIRFTAEYCRGAGDGQKVPHLLYWILAADAAQIMLNPVFGHAFTMEQLCVHGIYYFRFVPGVGHTIHRIIDYTLLLAMILIYIVIVIRMPRLYRERFTVILGSMILAAILQVYYILSKAPIDRSMIGFGAVGIMVFYFAVIYRPFRLLDRVISNVASGMPEALFVFDPNNKCIWANEPGLRLAHINKDQLDKATNSLKNIFGDISFVQEDWSENRVIGTGDSAQYFSIEMHSVKDDTQRLAGSFLILRDNTEEQQRIKREMYNSIHDSLTGLYTKQYFFECIKKMLESDTDITYLAVFADVKNFKIVNDIFSSSFGDLALKQIAGWISKNMNDKCVYGRLAGDTFGILVPKDHFDADKLEKELSSFTVSDGLVEHHIIIQLGVYEASDRSTDVSVMFDRAHLALSMITDEYNTHIAYYDNKLREQVVWDQSISGALSEAIADRQLRPFLQPITDRSGKVVGAEALARWMHPVYGFLSPARFIPVFEKNGMIVEVDKHMWRCACEILSRWKGKWDELFISINISPKDFYFIDVISEIKSLVKKYDIEPARLRIEITETVMMNEAEERMRILDELRKAGFIVEMDDFGSGYSSLNLLKDMPVDVLKLDMKFLSSSSDDERSQTIIKNIIRLTDYLGVDSLTEGVETKQQYEQLSEMGCKLFQGYYFAKPMPVDEFEAFSAGKIRSAEI